MLEPQFIRGSRGSVFVIYHSPHPSVPQLGQVLFIHPFAEEMNKARRMVALQARWLAAIGFGVLVPDLHGCGDSSGDFNEARWETWLSDLVRCLDWLQTKGGRTVVGGLRAGALLAVELARDQNLRHLILWQPVLSGEQMLMQFLRLRTAAGLMSGNKETVTQLRDRLRAGHSLEVAGYELHPSLADALSRAHLQAFTPVDGTQVGWFEVVAQADRPLLPASQRIVEAWQGAGADVVAKTIIGEPFWSTQEITLVPGLLNATTDCLKRLLPHE